MDMNLKVQEIWEMVPFSVLFWGVLWVDFLGLEYLVWVNQGRLLEGIFQDDC
jgi:hypothetical protein